MTRLPDETVGRYMIVESDYAAGADFVLAGDYRCGIADQNCVHLPGALPWSIIEALLRRRRAMRERGDVPEPRRATKQLHQTAPPAHRSLIVGTWVPCEERMPDTDRRVLIGGRGWFELGSWRGDHWRVYESMENDAVDALGDLPHAAPSDSAALFSAMTRRAALMENERDAARERIAELERQLAKLNEQYQGYRKLALGEFRDYEEQLSAAKALIARMPDVVEECRVVFTDSMGDAEERVAREVIDYVVEVVRSEVRRALDAEVRDVACTGLTARWCPVHGDCTCQDNSSENYSSDLDNPDCPLHASLSTHAEAQTDSPADSQGHGNDSAESPTARAGRSPGRHGIEPGRQGSDGSQRESGDMSCAPELRHRPAGVIHPTAPCVVCKAPRTAGAMGWQDLLCERCYAEFCAWRASRAQTNKTGGKGGTE